MVVEYDDVEPEPRRFRKRLETDRAAIDGDDELRAGRMKLPHRLDARAIAFGDAVGNPDQRLAAERGQIFAEQRRRAGAVDVVVAEDGDPLAARDRSRQPLGRRRHVGERVRVGHEIAQRRLQVALDRVEFDAAPGEDAGDEVAASGQLRDRLGPRLARRVEPRPPATAGERGFDVEERARHGVAGARSRSLSQMCAYFLVMPNSAANRAIGAFADGVHQSSGAAYQVGLAGCPWRRIEFSRPKGMSVYRSTALDIAVGSRAPRYTSVCRQHLNHVETQRNMNSHSIYLQRRLTRLILSKFEMFGVCSRWDQKICRSWRFPVF